MSERITAAGFDRIFIESLPLLDVRAPGEFAQGAFPTAANLPLLTDNERHQVGLCYKRQNELAAVALGHELVSGQALEERMRGWMDWCRRHPGGLIYCFRGGMRSATVQGWLADAGYPLPRIHGGYKALRHHLLESFSRTVPELPFLVLAGRTGCGKTRVIASLGLGIDLEGLARHRGSAFGRRPGGQPSQADFENALAIVLLRLMHGRPTSDGCPVVVEDESKLIGHRLIPPALHARMQTAPRVLIEEPIDDRVQVTLEDYILDPMREYADFHGEEHALDRLGSELLTALDRIRSRLGNHRHGELRAELEAALAVQSQMGSIDVHRGWIRRLLSEYYDPQYDHALRRKGEAARPVFVGNRNEVTEFLRQRTAAGTMSAAG